MEVPNPLSSNLTGIDSPSTFDVAQIFTPAPRPNRRRPTHISLKLSYKDRIDPNKPIELNQIRVFFEPLNLTQSPPKRDPVLIPIIDAVESTVI